jgi:7-cyano-7-deazaguanine synthase
MIVKSVALLSGGINSLVAVMRVLDETHPAVLYVDHGHRAAGLEQKAAGRIAQALALPLHVVELPSVSKLVSGRGLDTPKKIQAKSEAAPTGPGRTPGTMLAMMGMAQRLAVGLGADQVICGVSQTCSESSLKADHGGAAPDARFAFVHAAQVGLDMGMPKGRSIKLEVPFIDLGRADIVRLGQRLGAPLHLTWSCHNNGDGPCGRCGGCVSRRAAFAEAGTPDPMESPATHAHA